jgi:hypothetical protein
VIPDPLLAGGYLALKCAAYTGWMYVGLRVWTPSASLLRALELALWRLLLGIVLGFGIYVASTLVALSVGTYGVSPQIVAYLVVYVPVRWFEWAILERSLRPLRSVRGFLLDVDRRGRGWRVGGIAVSCAADLVLFSYFGSMPIGRFFC